MSNKIYIDGCSHTVGHKIIDGSLETLPNYLQKIFVKQRGQQEVIEAGATAKCNEAMFFDFLNCFDILEKNDSVFIYWSHSERITQRVLDSVQPVHFHNKYLNNIVPGKNLNPAPYDTPLYSGHMYSNTTTENLAWSFLYRTYMHMYAVQEMCKSKGINYYFMTVDPYYKFQLIPKEYREQAPVDESNVFNWPMPEVALWETFNRDDYNNFLVEWCLTSTPLLLGRALSKENKSQYIAKDYKHLKEKGHGILYNWLIEWMENPNRDLSWIINNKLTHEAAREFSTLQFHLKEFNLDGFDTVHWVEQVIEELVEQLTPAITYVYE